MTRHAAFMKIVNRLSAELGDDVARRVLLIFVAEIGAVRIKIPTFDAIKKAERNRKIVNQYRGANLEELALRYRLSKNQVRRIVARGNDRDNLL